MGASISCSLFETFATFLEYKTETVLGSDAILHYLDYFLLRHQKAPKMQLDTL